MRLLSGPLLALAVWGTALAVAPGTAAAAETTDPIAMGKTLIVLKLDAEAPLAIRTSFQDSPPTLVIEFPERQVSASLPERSAVAQGIIQAITARYETSPSAGQQPTRFLRALQIVLNAPYAYRVRSAPNRIIVEIDHPASMSSAALEVGLRGGTIIGRLSPTSMSERFRAMQEALARATPTPWSLQIHQTIEQPARASAERSPSSAQAAPRARPSPSRLASVHVPSAAAAHPRRHSAVWVLGLLGAAVIGAAWFRRRQLSAIVQGLRMHRQPRGGGDSGQRPVGLTLIDQLIWRAFERQGYGLVMERELVQPPLGTFRVMVKEGAKAALLFVGNGPFFEKQTVEHFVRAMRQADVAEGMLVAAGSFTVPAQRVAKEHAVRLIGRDQLAELLSEGAMSEHFSKQLEQQQAQLDEAQQAVRSYAEELDTLRRQRNEASWYLGEERAKSARLEAQLGEVEEKLRQLEADLQRWQAEAQTLRTQWDESQWYLGESKAHVEHLERQRSALQDIAQRVEQAERQRDEANWYLGEERTRRQTLEEQFTSLQASFEQLSQAFRAVNAQRGRRRHARVPIRQAVVELFNGTEAPFFTGPPRDVSNDGVGLDTDHELPAQSIARLRLLLPGREPIESKAQLVWQHAIQRSPDRYQSGCQLVDFPDATRAHIQQLIEETQSVDA